MTKKKQKLDYEELEYRYEETKRTLKVIHAELKRRNKIAQRVLDNDARCKNYKRQATQGKGSQFKAAVCGYHSGVEEATEAMLSNQFWHYNKEYSEFDEE